MWPHACPEPCALSAVDASPAATSVCAITRLSRCGMQRGVQGGTAHLRGWRLPQRRRRCAIPPVRCVCTHFTFCLTALHAAHFHAHQHSSTCSPRSPARRPSPRSFRVLPICGEGARENCRERVSEGQKKKDTSGNRRLRFFQTCVLEREGAAGIARGRQEAARLGARAWCSARPRSARL